jgi:hypothetical protein
LASVAKAYLAIPLLKKASAEVAISISPPAALASAATNKRKEHQDL